MLILMTPPCLLPHYCLVSLFFRDVALRGDTRLYDEPPLRDAPRRRVDAMLPPLLICHYADIFRASPLLLIDFADYAAMSCARRCAADADLLPLRDALIMPGALLRDAMMALLMMRQHGIRAAMLLLPYAAGLCHAAYARSLRDITPLPPLFTCLFAAARCSIDFCQVAFLIRHAMLSAAFTLRRVPLLRRLMLLLPPLMHAVIIFAVDMLLPFAIAAGIPTIAISFDTCLLMPPLMPRVAIRHARFFFAVYAATRRYAMLLADITMNIRCYYFRALWRLRALPYALHAIDAADGRLPPCRMPRAMPCHAVVTPQPLAMLPPFRQRACFRHADVTPYAAMLYATRCRTSRRTLTICRCHAMIIRDCHAIRHAAATPCRHTMPCHAAHGATGLSALLMMLIADAATRCRCRTITPCAMPPLRAIPCYAAMP